MKFVTTAALAIALTATSAMAQSNTYDSSKYIELHLILGQGKTRDARIIVFNHGTDEHQTTCARIMGVDLRCFSAAHHADGKWEVALPGVNNTELVDTYSQADALEGKLAVKALAGDLGAADWTEKDAAPVPAQAPREYLSQIQAPPPPPPPPLEPRRVRVFVACGYLTGDNFKSCYLKNYVAKKYPLIEGRAAAIGEALKRNGSYRVGLWPQGGGYDVSSKFGRTNVEYDAILCKVKTTAACAKEAYEFLDAVIQNDNASPTVQRPLVVNHDDGTASIYYQGRAINEASKSDVSSAVCELKKDDARCVYAPEQK
jgi:hypothetical protein